jgi:5-methylthioribose kinase
MNTDLSAEEETPTARARATVVEFGLLSPETEAVAVELSGGVSCESVAVHADGLDVVVKQALPRLRVEAEWLASEGRLETEATALRLVEELTPQAVPRVLAVDVEGTRLVVEHAPEGWRDWRAQLLEGRADPTVGERLGELLRTWRQRTSGLRLPALESHTGFVELRIDPFHRQVARRYPELAAHLERVTGRLLAAHECLVHGDFSPKNVLVGADGLWVIDWEIAHVGDPIFDVAFLCTHLLLKSVHRPQDSRLHRAAAAAFLSAYGDADERLLVENVGCLLLARVDGKSPAPYLHEHERDVVHALGRAVLLEPPDELDAVWLLV